MGVTLEMWHTYVTCDWHPSHFGVFLVWQTGVTFDMWQTYITFWCFGVTDSMSHVTDVHHNFSCDTHLLLSLTDTCTKLTTLCLRRGPYMLLCSLSYYINDLGRAFYNIKLYKVENTLSCMPFISQGNVKMTLNCLSPVKCRTRCFDPMVTIVTSDQTRLVPI